MIFLLPIIFFLLSSNYSLSQEIVLASTSATLPEASPSATIIPPTPTPNLILQYQNDYVYQYGLYNSAYINYVNKKQTDSQYDTITTKKEEFLAAREAIVSRNYMLRTYLMFLRVSLDTYADGNLPATQKYQNKIADWEKWLDKQAPTVSAINNESDLYKWATDYKLKYVDIQIVIYSSLVQHSVNQKTIILKNIQNLAQTIKIYPKFKPEGESWLNDIEIKSNLVNQSLNNAMALTQKPKRSNRFSNFYPDASVELSHANGYLIDMKNDLWATLIKYLQP